MKTKLLALSVHFRFSLRLFILLNTFYFSINLVTAQNQFVLKFFLQGYYTGNSTMTPVLYNQCISSGGTSCSSLYPLTDVDDVTIELHETTAPYDIVPGLSYTARLKTNGLCTINAPSGSYFLAITHRNSIQTWSHDPVQVDATHLFYDFSISANKAYGDNLTTEYFPAPLGNVDNDLVFKIFTGDISDPIYGVGTQDGISESQDYADMENAVSIRTCSDPITDLNSDGAVDLLDWIIMERNVYYIRVTIRP
jgi:hypothetical protein